MIVQFDECPKHIESLVASQYQGALSILLKAKFFATSTDSDPWDFAVDIRQLRLLGLTENDLRFLIRLNYINHGDEIVVGDSIGRQFVPSNGRSFSDDSCFVLTEKGIELATRKVRNCRSLKAMFETSANEIHSANQILAKLPAPYWDSQRRILWLDQMVVKEFRWQAANQERVLAAFQEEDWPARILDPLAPQPACVMKRRLSDTIKCLNRSQQNPLIRFLGDGTGEGVRWENAW
jgi:hypothetical protein